MAERFDPEGSGYDYETALAHGMGPDETGHWSSREPETGQILKGRGHKTFGLTREGELSAGYRMFKGQDGKYYSAPEEDDLLRRNEIEIWKQRLSEEQNLPQDWREGIYQGIVERLKSEHPGLRSLPTSLVMKLMNRESKFDPRAVGSAGEIGLMQVKPNVAEEVMRRRALGAPEDLADPRENILAGMSYLQSLSKQLGGIEPAVEAYNVGPGDYRKGKRNPNYVRAVLARGVQ